MCKNNQLHIRKAIVVILAITIVASNVNLASASTIKSTASMTSTDSMASIQSTASSLPITELFHDQGYIYMTPIEPTTNDDVTLRIRTQRDNVTYSQIQYTADNGSTWKTVDMTFEYNDDTGYFDLWKGVIPAQESAFYYRFLCGNDSSSNTVYYHLKGVSYSASTIADCWYVMTGYSTPDWAKGALWYSLVPDAYFNGDTTNDESTSGNNTVNSWNNSHSGLTDKYGGDLSGVLDKLAYIQDLNVDGIYMNPIFSSNQNVGYGSIDFNQIESSFGNAQTFIDLCNNLHSNNIKVMMDAAITFVSTDSIWFNANSRWPILGAKQSLLSRFHSLFKFDDDTLTSYKSLWSGAALNLGDGLAKQLIYTTSNSFLQQYISSPYNVDAIRFDCGGSLWGETADGTTLSSIDIITDIRKYLKQIDPNVLLLSEYSGNSGMTSYGWDSRWNLYFKDILTSYAAGNTSESTLSSVMDSTLRNLPRPVALCIYNMLSSHDESRLYTTDDNKYLNRAAQLILMTYIGSPSIYYGEEINLNRDSGSFYAMEWDKSNWDYSTYNFYHALTELRSKYTAIKTGVVRKLVADDTSNILAYGRWDENGTVVTIANQNNSLTATSLNVRLLSIADGTVLTDWLTGATYTVVNGYVNANVIPGGTILVSGSEASSYRQEYELTQIGSTNDKVADNMTVSVGSTDYTSTYQSSQQISLTSGQTVDFSNIEFGSSNSLSYSADVYFPNGTSYGYFSLNLGTGTYNSTTQTFGAIIRPGNQGGYGYAKLGDSGFLHIWGLKATADNIYHCVVEYANGTSQFWVNGNYMQSVPIDLATKLSMSDINLSLGLYSSMTCTVSNIEISGDVSNTAIKSGIITADSDKYVIFKNGTISGSEDGILFANTEAYNDFAYSTSLAKSNGKAALMIRNTTDTNSKYYAAVVNGSTLTVMARTSDGAVSTAIASASISENSCIRISRDISNTFTTYVTQEINGVQEWVCVANSQVEISMNNNVKAGFVSLSGSTTFGDVTITQLNGVIGYDNFNNDIAGALLNGTTASNVSVADGYLTITPDSNITVLSTNSQDNDWTFKAELNYTPTSAGNYAGVISQQDENSYVFAGRTVVGEKSVLILGKVCDGQIVSYFTAEDLYPDEDVIVQLQRIGATYSAVYSYDGNEWFLIGDNLFANYSVEYVGIFAEGSQAVSFNYVSFGDCMNDGLSVNTPQTPKTIDTTYNKTSSVASVSKYTIVSGSWDYATEGFIQTDTTNLAQMSVYNRTYDGFRAEATFAFDSGSGWAGMGFSKSSSAGGVTDGFLLKYTTDYQLILLDGDTIIATYQLSNESNSAMKVVLECKDDIITVYTGQDATPVIEVHDKGCGSGYFCYYTSGVVAHVNSYNVYDTDASWYVAAGTFIGASTIVCATTSSKSLANLSGYAFTNFIASTNISLEAQDGTDTPAAGILLCASQAKSPSNGGVLISIDENGLLSMTENGIVLDSHQLTEGITSVYLMIVKQDGTYNIYADNGSTPVLSYTETYNRGGVYSLYSVNSKTEFSKIHITNLQAAEDYTQTEIYQLWMAGIISSNGTNKVYSEHFSDSDTALSNLSIYNGSWKVADGVLKCTEKTGWMSGVACTQGMFDNFEMSFNMRIDAWYAAWAAVEFRKFNTNGSHESNGLTLRVDASGTLAIYSSLTKSDLCSSQIPNFVIGSWYNLKIICQGTSVTVYYANQCVMACTDTAFLEGYISLNSGNILCSYDDVVITPYNPAAVNIETMLNGSVTVNNISAVKGDTVTITVAPDTGYQLAAGSLAYSYTDSTSGEIITCYIINRAGTSTSNKFIFTLPTESVTISADFAKLSRTSVSLATMGTSLHYTSGVCDGIRFVTRMYLPKITYNAQKDNFTVKYNGEEYSVIDYGALIIPTQILTNKGKSVNDLTLDNASALTALQVSAKNGKIYDVADCYIDFTVVMLTTNTSREYAIKGYTQLQSASGDTIVIYGNVFTDNITKAQGRIQSQG